jgi:hypothetical protein
MSTPIKSAVVVAMVAAAAVRAAPISAAAAELLPPHVHHRYVASCCGLCGCLHASYVYHRELRSTYGLSFDPRNFDQTEPYYHFGALRAYPRYWVDSDPAQ